MDMIILSGVAIVVIASIVADIIYFNHKALLLAIPYSASIVVSAVFYLPPIATLLPVFLLTPREVIKPSIFIIACVIVFYGSVTLIYFLTSIPWW